MAVPAIWLAAAAVGTGISIYGQIKQSEAQAEALQREAASRELEANEIMKRTKINQEIVEEEGQILLGEQETFFGKYGGTGGSPMLVLARTANKIAREKQNMQMEAEFRASQLRSGAAVSRDMAGATLEAGRYQAAGTLLTSGASMYRLGKS